MANFFGNANNTATQAAPRDTLQGKYNSARANLILVIVFTLINTILAFTASNTYFLFSLFAPYIMVYQSALYTGNMPGAYTDAEMQLTNFLPDSVFHVMLACAGIIIALFVLCWVFSKKNKVGWIIAALVLVIIDTLIFLSYCLTYDIIGESIIDIIFHAWVIISLIGGISAYNKLNALPPEEEIIDTTAEVVAEVFTDNIPENSTVLRPDHLDDKCKILLEVETDSLHITYRRVKKVNELVINGNVYDEYVALIEGVHTLSATFASHKIEAGFDGYRSFIKIDGETVAKKLRLV